MFEGIISHEEYRKYVTFQEHVDEDPAIKELNAEITGHMKEVRRLRAQTNAMREKLISANPEIKAIRDKISGAVIRFSTGARSMPMPVPVKSN